MASITKKDSRRYRIQFSMDRKLFENYETIQARAKELGLVIDYNEEFSWWFGHQLRDLTEKLKEHEARLSQEGGGHE